MQDNKITGRGSDYLRYELDGNAIREEYYPDEVLIPEKPSLPEKKKEPARHVRLHLDFGRASMIVMTVLLVAVLLSCANYVRLRAREHEHLNNLKKLQSEYDDLILKNNTRQTMVDASIDYDEIYRIATKELGMKYPGKQQVLWYNSTEREYVSQYEDIPKN